MKRILIDVNSVVPYFALGKLSGIGRTTMELVRALDAVEDIPFDIMLFSQNMKGIGAKDLNAHFNHRHIYLPYRNNTNHWVSNLHLKEMLTGYDLMHIPHNYTETKHADKCVVTLHDAMFFSYPEEAFKPEYCKKYYTQFAQQVRAVITCSEASKKDIVEFMGIQPEKIHITYWGYNKATFYPHPDRKCDYPFFLSTSCSLGRKNTISVIRAFALFKQQGGEHHLSLVWRDPSPQVMDEIALLNLTDCVHFYDSIPDEELAQLYSDATACFFPSLYEGFGFPVLESMASGTPVITCRNSSLPEVGGDAALYVEPYDIEAMTEIMLQLERMSSDDLESLRQESLAQAGKFSWERCARQTLEVYANCLNA